MEAWILWWMERYIAVVRGAFGDRIVCIGLQGSFGREEATGSSDIDVVVILDKLTIDDLQLYREIIEPLSERPRICGFISGKDELTAWEKSDLFQFYYDTRVMYGTLKFLNNIITPSDARRAVLIGSCNIYHACAHNMTHAQELSILKALYKQAYFVLQAKSFCDNGGYSKNKIELRKTLRSTDKNIIDAPSPTPENFVSLSAEILRWASYNIRNYSL